MRSLLHITVWFAALVLLLSGLSEAAGFGLRKNRNLKLSAAENAGPAVDLLFLGPCEPLWSLSPALIRSHTGLSSYNLSLSNSDFADNYLHLYLYLKNNPAPRSLFVYVTPASFDSSVNAFNTFRFAPYLDDSVVREVIEDCDPRYYSWVWFPYMRYAYYNAEINFNVVQGYKHFFTGRQQAYYSDGYEPPQETVAGVRNGVFVRELQDTVRYSWDPSRERYLRKIIRLARSKGIYVYLYESPVIQEAMVLEKDRRMFVGRIETLARQENAGYRRFEKLGRSPERNFFNAPRNLNRKGVLIFADTFAGYLKALSDSVPLSHKQKSTLKVR
jgi:hypothetical protein